MNKAELKENSARGKHQGLRAYVRSPTSGAEGRRFLVEGT